MPSTNTRATYRILTADDYTAIRILLSYLKTTTSSSNFLMDEIVTLTELVDLTHETRYDRAILDIDLETGFQKDSNPLLLFSARVFEVFTLLLNGKDNKNISAVITLGVSTVSSHKSGIFKIINVPSSVEQSQLGDELPNYQYLTNRQPIHASTF